MRYAFLVILFSVFGINKLFAQQKEQSKKYVRTETVNKCIPKSFSLITNVQEVVSNNNTENTSDKPVYRTICRYIDPNSLKWRFKCDPLRTVYYSDEIPKMPFRKIEEFYTY